MRWQTADQMAARQRGVRPRPASARAARAAATPECTVSPTPHQPGESKQPGARTAMAHATCSCHMLTSVTSAVAVATCSSTLRAAAAGPAAGIGGISIRYTHTSVVTWPSQPRVPIYRSVVVRQQYWYDGGTMSSSMMMRPQSSGGQSSHHHTHTPMMTLTLRCSIII